MQKCDAVPGGGWIVEILRDWVIEAELPALGKQQNACGSELFRERTDVKTRRCCIRDVSFDICGTEASVSEHVSVADHKDAAHEVIQQSGDRRVRQMSHVDRNLHRWIGRKSCCCTAQVIVLEYEG
jgi:hypothetical protein